MIKEQHKKFLARYGSKEHMDKLAGDEDKYVRYNIASNPSLHKEHMDKLAGDKDRDVRNAIKNNPNYKP
jgi:hypothetical protein